jgi:DNA-binding transcriptional regulator GbsR (MarR family)
MKAVLQLLPGETATINFHIYDSLHSATQYRVTSLVEQNTKQEGDIVDRALDKLDKEISEEIEDDVEDGIEDVKKATKAVKDILEVEKEILDLL